MIEAVTFDLWHTLIFEPDEAFIKRTNMIRMRGIWRTLNELGYDISYDELQVAFHDQDILLERIWSMDRDVGERTQLKMLFDCLGIKKGRRELYHAVKGPYREALLKNMPALSEGVSHTLETLKDMGYALGIISNSGRTSGRGMRMVMEKLGVLHYFDVITFSNEMRIRKPQSNIFTRTLGIIGVRPRNAAHVGDDVVNDVSAARKVGMKGILYDENGSGRMGRKVDAVISTFDELPEALRNIGGI
ncbi:MAG: HAD family hydrolase [Thermoplasmata archaeon]